MELPVNTTAIFGGLTAASLVAFAWNWVRSIFSRIVSLLITTIHIDNEGTIDAVSAHCWATMKRTPIGPRDYGGQSEFVRPVRRVIRIAYEKLGQDAILFWAGWRPVLAGFGPNNQSRGNEPTNDNSRRATIRFIRGTFKPDELIMTALDRFNMQAPANQGKPSRFYIARLFGKGGRRNWGSDESKPSTAGRPVNVANRHWAESVRLLRWQPSDMGVEILEVSSPFDVLCYPKEVLELVEEAKHWQQSERWYKERQIPWRRGWLLHGRPGTGKSSLVKAIAQVEDLPIYSFDLSSMSNQDFVDAWEKVSQNVPCMPLFEDIDATFDKRSNKLGQDGGGLTFDCFLNTVGGINTVDGIFMVITTNHIEQIDEALGIAEVGKMSSRPGRIDRVLRFESLNPACRMGVARRVLRDYPEIIDKVVAEGEGETGAQFQERCARLALSLFWESKAKGS